MRKTGVLLCCILFLAACNQTNTPESFAQIVVVNDIEYGGTEEDIADYEVQNAIRNVVKKVPADVFPNNNESNFFEEGSIIYSVKNDTDFIIVEDREGERHLLQKAPGND
ncbi:hypothetical protein [Jeotgalibacillus sp. R-1-5s-1]|uniref:hypothetical protein n=1 Tax=Jeotgalibacillus sp. R-1-5s-1 TaxID=2555897 RepID=UPI00106BEB98|nr:hypothetical protein [Jeotgalibacillus sp. R-1-5s-1]TFD94359.1 hypothetical protein E2491_13020 [Jeotgalibacillus sp. R-1-5s-1]